MKTNTPQVLVACRSHDINRGVDKSLARPDWKKKIWKFVIFHPTGKSLLPRRPGWTDNLMNFFFWVACKS